MDHQAVENINIESPEILVTPTQLKSLEPMSSVFKSKQHSHFYPAVTPIVSAEKMDTEVEDEEGSFAVEEEEEEEEKKKDYSRSSSKSKKKSVKPKTKSAIVAKATGRGKAKDKPKKSSN